MYSCRCAQLLRNECISEYSVNESVMKIVHAMDKNVYIQSELPRHVLACGFSPVNASYPRRSSPGAE